MDLTVLNFLKYDSSPIKYPKWKHESAFFEKIHLFQSAAFENRSMPCSDVMKWNEKWFLDNK